MSKWMSISEAMEALGISERAIRYRVSKGTIQSKMEDGRRLICVDNGNELHENLAPPLHEQLTAIIDEKDARIADFQEQARVLQDQISLMSQQLREKDKQIDQKDEQLSHMEQLLAMQTKTNAMLNEQLSQSRLMIEDFRNRGMWKRLRAVFAGETF